MTRSFDGVRVVDLSDRLSGAFATRLFGDYGVDVVLAEPPTGHPLRHEPPFLDDELGLDRSVLHAYANWNKRSVVRDDPLLHVTRGCDGPDDGPGDVTSEVAVVEWRVRAAGTPLGTRS